MAEGLWVVGDCSEDGELSGLFELAGIGRKLADKLEMRVAAVALARMPEAVREELISSGADKVYQFENLECDDESSVAELLIDLVKEHKPSIVLGRATRFGRSVLPRVAAGLRTGLSADCTGLSVDDDGLLVTIKPAYGENVMAEVVCPERRPQMATVRTKAFNAGEQDTSRRGEIETVAVAEGESPRTVSIIGKRERGGQDADDLEKADIVIGIGRGLGTPDNLKIIRELAQKIGAALGATRAVVDAGWLPHSCQLGQTGKIISPRLYLACGLSGSVQHTVGIQGAETIVAINTDPKAPIFDLAHIGIVGDLAEVIPALTRELARLNEAASRSADR